MTQPTKTIDGRRVPVVRLEGRVTGIEGPHISVRIELVNGAPAGPEYQESTSHPGTSYERTWPLVYGAMAIDRRGKPVPVKLGDPVSFVLDAAQTTFLETRINGIVTQSHSWR